MADFKRSGKARWLQCLLSKCAAVCRGLCFKELLEMQQVLTACPDSPYVHHISQNLAQTTNDCLCGHWRDSESGRWRYRDLPKTLPSSRHAMFFLLLPRILPFHFWFLKRTHTFYLLWEDPFNSLLFHIFVGNVWLCWEKVGLYTRGNYHVNAKSKRNKIFISLRIFKIYILSNFAELPLWYENLLFRTKKEY